METRSFEEQLLEDKTLDKKPIIDSNCFKFPELFWELEAIGILSEERSVYEQFKDSIKYTSGQYEVELPWKETHPALPNNYALCQGRLKSLIRRLKSEEIIGECDAVIKVQLKNGIVERADHSAPKTQRKILLLPHHPVIRCDDKDTTKLCVDYDASAKTHSNPSSNDCFYSGLSLLPGIANEIPNSQDSASG